MLRWFRDSGLFIFLLLVSGVGWSAAPDGTTLYQQHCAVCHGQDGDGGVGVPLNLPDFLAVASNVYIRNTLRSGRPGRVMPAFTNLNDAEIDAIVAHVRGWAEQPEPIYTEERTLSGDAQRGGRLFNKNCVVCHGKNGQGGAGTGVTFSRKRSAPVMAPSLRNPGFQQSVSDEMLKATLLRGRHGTPMPSLKELGLAERDANDLVAYLRTLTAPDVHQEVKLSPVIRYDSSYSLEETLKNLKQAVVGRNFRVIREQYLDSGFAEPGMENKRQVILYFCNFSILNDALAVDPRVGLFLPCRITLLETDHGVTITSINPKSLSYLFNNGELDNACQRMYDLYIEIMEDATL